MNYLENDVELSTLTPATFLYQRAKHLPEEEVWRVEERDLRKQAKYLKAWKDSLWSRWKREYLVALRERHNLHVVHKRRKYQPKPGNVVIVQSDNKIRGKWPLAIVTETYPGKDGIIRAVRLKTENGTFERPVQHLLPMELNGDAFLEKTQSLDSESSAFIPRSRRDTAAAARLRMGHIADMDNK